MIFTQWNPLVKMRDGEVEIKWLGFPDTTWEPKSNIQAFTRCIKNICRRSCLNVKLPLQQNSKSHWSHLILLFLCQIILPFSDHSKLHWSHLLVLLLMCFFKSPLVQISKPCWSHLTLLFFVCLLKLPVVKDSKSQWSRLNLFVLCQFKLPVAEHSKSHSVQVYFSPLYLD